MMPPARLIPLGQEHLGRLFLTPHGITSTTLPIPSTTRILSSTWQAMSTREFRNGLLDSLHGTVYGSPVDKGKQERLAAWDARKVRGLRRQLRMTQAELAEELNVRQQTVSEWETGQYRPRGASERMLSVVAERAEVPYGE